MPRKRLDIAGQTINRLTVISFIPKRLKWLCKCSCGNEVIADGHAIKMGKIKSCGCLQNENRRNRATHGATRNNQYTYEYRCYRNMLNRCYFKKSKDYHNYGGRGITVCDRWKESFQNFFADMGPRPQGTSIDRENNNLGYSKENCRWATKSQQMVNMRVNHRLEYNGKSLTLTEWSKITRLSSGTIAFRIKSGWPVDKILTVPVNAPVQNQKKRFYIGNQIQGELL